MENKLLEKYELLKDYLLSLGSVAVAFSSGVDSTFLLYAAKDALGDKAVAITASLYSFPKRDMEEAKKYCNDMGIKHHIVRINELEIDGFAENPPNRCYICKRGIFQNIITVAAENGISEIVEGSNVDDEGDYRPGHVAIKELGIKSPLRHTGFTKNEIRELSKHFDIPTWNKPSFACLSSRFPYGETITETKLTMVDKAEQLLFEMGFKQYRVRIHGDVARIELPVQDFPVIMEEKNRLMIYEKMKEHGFSYVSLDLLGYRTGSMNETIDTVSQV